MAGEAATALRGRAAGPSRSRSPSPPRFTALELAAAEHLIHLSESSCSSGAAAAPTPRAGLLLLPASAASSSTSPRSVNNAPPPPAAPPAAAAEGDEDEVGGRRRRNRRYRPIAEIYAATDPKPIGTRRRKKAAEDRPRTDGAAAKAKAKELGATP